jgi:hypothetical protein
MRRFWFVPLLALAVLGAACSDDGGGGSPTTDDVTDEVTDETEDDARLDSDTGDNTGDNTGDDDDADPSDVAPIEILDSFTGEFETEFQFVESGSVVVRSEATYVEGDQDCTVVTSLLDGREQDERAVVVGDEAFYSEDGVGRRIDPDDAEVVDTLDTCVSSESFWDGFPNRDELGEGNPADFNGIPSERFDLLANDDNLDEPLDLPPGFEADQFDIWIADDGGWVAGSSIRYSGPARGCRDLLPPGEGADEECTIRLDVRIADPDDTSLEVSLPRN